MFFPVLYVRVAPDPLGPQSPPLLLEEVNHLPEPHAFCILCPHDSILHLSLTWKEDGGETEMDIRSSPYTERHNSGLTFQVE